MNKSGGILLFILLFFTCLIEAHVPNQSYIFLRIYEGSGIEGRYEMNTREINKVFDTNFGEDFTLDQLTPHLDELKNYLLKNSSFNSKSGNHKIVLKGEPEILSVAQGDFVKIFFELENTRMLPDDLTVNYSAVFEKDDTHKGFLITEYNWKAGVINDEMNISLDFAPGDTKDTMSLTETSLWKGFVAMVKQGVWHIWIGIDHILFLLALILPSVVRRKKNLVSSSSGNWFKRALASWEPVSDFKSAFFFILKVITFFTIAHTITLTLATLEVVSLPSQLVESIIALSIGLAAFHNIRPILKGRDWIIAFVFGLFHGFGFASVLGDLGLTSKHLTISLLGFNIGVEIGQLLIIALIFPILFLLRKMKLYNRILIFGSIILIVISVYWGLERMLDVSFGVERNIKLLIRDILISIGLWS